MFERLKKYDKKAIGQFIRFGIVGIINTLITLIVIYFLQIGRASCRERV